MRSHQVHRIILFVDLLSGKCLVEETGCHKYLADVGVLPATKVKGLGHDNYGVCFLL